MFATVGDVFAITTGFFFVLWIMSMRRKKERKWYRTEMPSTYIIEKEA